jgi:hypothetical protein
MNKKKKHAAVIVLGAVHRALLLLLHYSDATFATNLWHSSFETSRSDRLGDKSFYDLISRL